MNDVTFSVNPLLLCLVVGLLCTVPALFYHWGTHYRRWGDNAPTVVAGSLGFAGLSVALASVIAGFLHGVGLV